ncbi:hypothetical protein NDU88_007250 [Pleurodeles waltl]|uniref:Uncharacterized protein n=1 Tax=Pleurodeles waltl TaxID=8319 RepID=A0AAV7QR23_PLEWA|nr:hypothetical protein NDU88_007250 [Pleurodeles waltl]
MMQGETNTVLTREDGCLLLLRRSLPRRFPWDPRHDRENTARPRTTASLEPPLEGPHLLVLLATSACSDGAFSVRLRRDAAFVLGRCGRNKKAAVKMVFFWAEACIVDVESQDIFSVKLLVPRGKQALKPTLVSFSSKLIVAKITACKELLKSWGIKIVHFQEDRYPSILLVPDKPVRENGTYAPTLLKRVQMQQAA